MPLLEVLQPIVLITNLAGVAPLKLKDHKFKVNHIWLIINISIAVVNNVSLIYISIFLYLEDRINTITTDFTLILDSFLCIFSNCGTNIAMLMNCKKLSYVLNELITIESTYLSMAEPRIKYIRNKYFLLQFSFISWISLLCIFTAIMKPLGNGQPILQGVHFLISELVLLAVICSYYSFLMLIGFLYEGLKDKLGMWIANINSR